MQIHNISINNEYFMKSKKFKLYYTLGINLGISIYCIPPMAIASAKKSYYKNLYQKELDDYNKSITEYASYINNLNLSDLEIIVKVMYDMWNNIQGYKYIKSSDDYHKFPRLSLHNKGYGVCKHMADDFTARMNAINPEYEACNIIVECNDVDPNQIERNIIEEEATINSLTQDKMFKIHSKISGNHMVSCIKLPRANQILVIDPTNLSIGLLKNGKIELLSDTAKDSLQIKPIGNTTSGFDSFNAYTKKIEESFTTGGNYEAIKKQYGIDAQNSAINTISSYNTENYKTK